MVALELLEAIAQVEAEVETVQAKCETEMQLVCHTIGILPQHFLDTP